MSIAGLSSGALFAKSKACFTGLMSSEDYSTAASFGNLAEFAAFLKNKTAYSEAFDGIGGSAKMTRQRLEAIIKRMTLLRLEKVIRYAKLSDSFVSEYLLIKHECECIISRMRQHGEYTLDSYLLYMPDGFFKNTCFDIAELEKAHTSAEIKSVLEKTPYSKILAYVFDKNDFGGRLVPENLLYRYLYETGDANFEKKLSKKDYAEVKELLSLLSDMITIGTVYRIKKYYSQSEDLMLHVFGSSLTHFSQARIEELKNAQTYSEFVSVLEGTRYKGLVPLLESDRSALFTKQYIYNFCRKKFASSCNPALSALCYARLVSAEADNLVTITEGVSSGTNPEKILSMLIR